MAAEDHTPELQEGSDAGSEGTSSAPRPGSVKDRKCPFCHQPFTSSSLGRHLDTFIRERNPKPPDGVHSVHEIKKIRSTITRRHARVSAAKDNAQKKDPHSPVPSQRPLPQPSEDPLRPRDAHHHSLQQSDIPPPLAPRNASFDHGQRIPTTVHSANWTATGVINNLPPRIASTPNSRDPYLSRTGQNSYRYADAEDRRTAQAAEYALREVLQVVHNAAKQSRKVPVFDFDFFSLNYPGLCLRLLSPPTSLSSNDPQRTSRLWPLDLPSRADLQEIALALWDRMNEYDVRPQHKDESQHTSTIDHRSAEHEKYFRHAERCYDDWAALPEIRKTESWKLEIMRAYAEEATRRKEADHKVEALQQQNEQLKMQLASVHTSSLPYPSQAVIKSLVDNDELMHWNLNDLISKWKSNISQRQGMAYTAPAQSGMQNATPQTSDDAVATPSSSHSHAGGTAAGAGGNTEFAGWGLVDGVPRPEHDAGWGVAHGIPRPEAYSAPVRGNPAHFAAPREGQPRDVQMTDVSTPLARDQRDAAG